MIKYIIQGSMLIPIPQDEINFWNDLYIFDADNIDTYKFSDFLISLSIKKKELEKLDSYRKFRIIKREVYEEVIE